MFKKKMVCTICVGKTKALISCVAMREKRSPCYQPGLTKTGLYSHRRLEAWNFIFKKKKNSTILAQLISAFSHIADC